MNNVGFDGEWHGVTAAKLPYSSLLPAQGQSSFELDISCLTVWLLWVHCLTTTVLLYGLSSSFSLVTSLFQIAPNWDRQGERGHGGA